MDNTLFESVKKEINNEINLNDKYKEQYFPLSPLDDIRFKLDEFENNEQLDNILIGQCGNGLYHTYYIKYNKKTYEVCIWGIEKRIIYYIKDLTVKRTPNSPFKDKNNFINE